MTNIKKIFISLFCLTFLVCLADAADKSESASWSDWTHDQHVLPELYLRSRCVQDPANSKKAVLEVQFRDVGDSLVEVKDKDWKYDVPAHYQVGTAQVPAKSCAKLPELKMDGSVPVKGYGYKITYKDGTLTVKPHDHHHIDWAGWATAGLMGAAAMSDTMAQNNAQMAEIRAQQQAQLQAAAAARAEQLAQMQAQQQAQAARAEQAAAQRAAQAAQQAQIAAQQAQVAAQQAANQRAAQAASQSAQNHPANSGGFMPGSSTPQPRPSDLSISQNYTDNSCNNGSILAHFQLSNNSYSNANMTVRFDYQVGGVTTSFTETHNIGPRTSNDYSRTIQCGGDPQLSDFGGRSYILQFQFY
jgi:hypothetical protein